MAAKRNEPVCICPDTEHHTIQVAVLDTKTPTDQTRIWIYTIKRIFSSGYQHQVSQWSRVVFTDANSSGGSQITDQLLIRMFSLGAARYYLYREPTDIRKSFDGLCGLVCYRLGQSPMSGDVFIFINKPRNRIKLLRWEIGGFVLFYKRLEKGTFELPQFKNGGLSQMIDYGELAMIITGISMKNAKKRTRFLQQNDVEKYR